MRTGVYVWGGWSALAIIIQHKAVGIWRRKLILPSAVALACVSMRKRVCVLPKNGSGEFSTWNEGCCFLPAELWHRSSSDAAWHDITAAAILAHSSLSTLQATFPSRQTYREKAWSCSNLESGLTYTFPQHPSPSLFELVGPSVEMLQLTYREWNKPQFKVNGSCVQKKKKYKSSHNGA